MSLTITPTIIRFAYEFLCECPPFDKWNLPDGDSVDFSVSKSRLDHGWITTGRRRKRPRITISETTTGHTPKLLETLAHEMVHLHQYLTGQPQTHGKAFKSLAARVCKIHGFDLRAF
jgi:hypothetical protein